MNKLCIFAAKKMRKWIIAIRPWSFPASVMPALVVFSYIFLQYRSGIAINVNWINGILAMCGALIFQAAGNLICDYYDFKFKVDKKESFGSSRVLVDEVFQPKTILIYGIILLVIGTVIGLILCYNSGIQLLWIGIIGVLSTYFYYQLKYQALGDLIIFIVYGLLIALGTGYVMTNQLSALILLIAAPIGFLVVNILHANNTRDIKYDKSANIRTQAMLLGIKGSILEYEILVVMSYLAVIMMVIFKVLPLLSLCVLITLPLAYKNICSIRQAKIDQPEKIKDLDGSSAMFVLIFSMLIALANFIAGYFCQ